MKNMQSEYHTSVNQHPVPDKLISQTKSRMECEATCHKKSKIRWCVVIPACALVTVCSVAAIAYSVTYGFAKSPYEPRVNKNIPSAVMQVAGNQVEKTVEKNGLIITIKNTVCDNKLMYVTLDIKSKNGTPLQESTEFRKSMLPQERFEKSSLTVDNKNYDCTMFRTDDASVADKASYEAQINGNFTNKSGKNAALSLSNLTDNVFTCENAGFLFNNLGELYNKMIPENPSNFINTGKYTVYSDKSSVPSWTIPAGKQHVKFSSQFPDSYIDNIGFHKTGEYGCQTNMLYISITPGNQKDAATLKKLCFQNTNTMNPTYFNNVDLTGNGIEQVGFDSQDAYTKAWLAEINRKLSLNGNRIVIALDLCSDDNTLTRDCTVADLSHYRIMKNFNMEQVARCSGNWEIPFALHFTDTTRSFNVNQTITVGKSTAKVQNVSISDLSISITGVLKSGKADHSSSNIKLICKDGSAIDVGPKVGGSFDANGNLEISGNLSTLIDANNVTAIQLWDNRIALSK